MKNAIKKNENQEGLLGRMPEGITSVAELMVHDSDINVYEDSNVVLPESAEFNIRGRKQKVLSKQDRKVQELVRQNIIRQ